MTNQRQLLLSGRLQPDYVDPTSSGQLLPSFRDIRRKTLRSLYGLAFDNDETYDPSLLLDKSPKGTVDDPIIPLVNLINSHPAYATLSSCSGRIALFDPNCRLLHDNGDKTTPVEGGENDAPEEEETSQFLNKSTPGSGKGSGRWALSCHSTITTEALVTSLAEESDQISNGVGISPLIFKHEALLLHIAASSLTRAQKLLSLALSLGFRESGIVSTPKRVMVAIRGVGLSLTVPLARSGPLRPSPEYLDALVTEANNRFRLNEAKLERLYQAVRETLFVPVDSEPHQGDNYTCSFGSLPQLNLANHATAIIPIPHSADSNVYVFGGHGTGPRNDASSSRSGHIYCLSSRRGKWAESWIRQELSVKKFDDEKYVGGVRVRQASFRVLEGLAACSVQMDISDDNAPIIIIFGGRAGPGHPSNDLYLYDPLNDSGVLWSPIDVRGKIPSPRWGHTLTALPERHGASRRLATLVGGRDSAGVMSTAYVLACVDSHIEWEKVTGEIGLFHHISTHFKAPAGDDFILSFGGLENPPNVLESFSRTKNGPNFPIASVLTVNSDGHHTARHLKSDAIPRSLTGAAASCIQLKSMGNYKNVIVISGGVSVSNEDESAFWALEVDFCADGPELTRAVINCPTVNVGSMVHHSSIALPVTPDMVPRILLIGGGVSSFAFSPNFSCCWEVSLRSEATASKVGVSVSTTKLSAVPSAKVTGGGAPMIPFDAGQDARSGSTTVAYVEKAKAKQLKIALEGLGYLDRSYRMLRADASCPLKDPRRFIAVPITRDCMDNLSFENDMLDGGGWTALISGTGEQIVPFSSVVLGRMKTNRC